MLNQIVNARQIAGEPERLWFLDDYFDLIVWMEPDCQIAGFQLCYDKKGAQHALTWHDDAGYKHFQVDDGESRPGKHKSAPIFMDSGPFLRSPISERFKEASRKIDAYIAEFVYEKIKNYPEFHTV